MRGSLCLSFAAALVFVVAFAGGVRGKQRPLTGCSEDGGCPQGLQCLPEFNACVLLSSADPVYQSDAVAPTSSSGSVSVIGAWAAGVLLAAAGVW